MHLPPGNASFPSGVFFFCAVASQNLYCDKYDSASKYPKIPKLITSPTHAVSSLMQNMIQKPNVQNKVRYSILWFLSFVYEAIQLVS